MINLFFQNPEIFFILSALLVMAIAVHEFSHALTSDRLGDPTARLAGRLTLNPLAHLDPLGTILLLFAGFGWGKPVSVDPFNLRNPKKDSALVSFAGPFSNLLIAFISSVFLRFVVRAIPLFFLNSFMTELVSIFIQYNVILAVFNLIPVHPLDGFNVVAGLIPKKYYEDWLSLSRYGMIFLIILIFPFFGPPPISSILSPIVNFFLSILLPVKIGGVI